MNYAAAIAARLGVDTKPFSDGMNNAATIGQRAGDKIAQGTNRAAKAHDQLAIKTRGASRAIHTFAQDLANGADAAQIFSDGLMGIGKSLGLSLGALAGLGIGAVAVGKIAEIREEYRKLDEALKQVYKDALLSGDFKTLGELEQQAKKAEEAIKSLQDRIDARSMDAPDAGIFQRIKDLFARAPIFLQDIPGALGMGAEDKASLAGANADRDKLQYQKLDKRRARSDAKASGDYLGTKANELQNAHDEANPAVHELTQAAIELHQAFKDLAADVTAKRRERAGMTLGELAATPQIATAGMTRDQWLDGQKARQAQSLDAQAEEARRNNRPDEAQDLWNKSAAIKSDIGNLKPSELTPDALKGALTVTEDMLRQIVANTAGGKTLVNR
jgi:hypothetical protein